jgi:hypothetical protein
MANKKEDDLILGPEVDPDLVSDDEETDIPDSEIDFFETPPGAYIEAAYAAICAVDGMDGKVMSKEDERRILRVKRKSLRLIDHFIGELYDSVFVKDDDD